MREEKPVRVIHLSTLTHGEFLILGNLIDYKIQRMPTVAVKKADGITEINDMLRLDESTMSLDIKFRSRGEMMRKPDGSWLLLEPGFLESRFDFLDDGQKKIFEHGGEALCRDKPWTAIMLQEDALIINREGERNEAGLGDYIAQYRQDVPWYTYVPYQLIEMGGYQIVHGGKRL